MFRNFLVCLFIIGATFSVKFFALDKSNSNCVGHDMGDAATGLSKLDCWKSCKGTTGCFAFAYEKAVEGCQLQSDACEESELDDASGIHYYALAPEYIKQAKKKTCEGGDVGEKVHGSKNDCWKACQKITECLAFVYLKDEKACSLKSKACSDEELENDPNADYYVVDKPAPVIPTQPPTTPVPTRDPNACQNPKTKGVDYFGTFDKTVTGRTCMKWSDQTPHSHGYGSKDSSFFRGETMEEASNYCRNPDITDPNLWCYTSDPSVRWEFCDIPVCKEAVIPDNAGCYDSATKGADYTGTLQYTERGFECQKWSEQTPNAHGNKDPSKFPDETIADASNYCRNPMGDPRPWCYTLQPGYRYDFCEIPKC